MDEASRSSFYEGKQPLLDLNLSNNTTGIPLILNQVDVLNFGREFYGTFLCLAIYDNPAL